MLMKPLALAMLMAASASQVAFADLHDRGGGMIYDDVLNVTWLQDANYAKTSGYDADGMMNWNQATDWAEQLIYGGHSDWRLPELTPVNGSFFTYNFSDLHSGNSDVSWNNSGTNSELGYMYHVNLGNAGSCNTSGLPSDCESLEDQPGYIANFTYNPGPFKNFSRGPDEYTTFWTKTLSPWERDPSEYPEAWVFHFTGGGQDPDWVMNSDNFAWAVRDGDVGSLPQANLVHSFLGDPGTGTLSFESIAYDSGAITQLVIEGAFGLPNFMTPGTRLQVFDVLFSGPLPSPVELSFEYDPTLLPDGFDEANLRVFHWTGTEWENLGGVVDAANNTITVTTNSLSPFAVAAVPEPETYALMLAGLGLVGGFAAKHRA